MINQLDNYMESLNSDVQEHLEFCRMVDNFFLEAWGGCPEALYELGKYLQRNYPYREMADYFIRESAKAGYGPAIAYKAILEGVTR